MSHSSIQTQASTGGTNSIMHNQNVSAGPPIPAPRMALRPPVGVANVPRGKRVVMRLKCRFRPLHEVYFQDGKVMDQDADVIFICADGRVKGHKIILASSSKFFTDIFIDQKAGEISTVYVPDVRSDVMKLLILMTYKDNVIVTTDQIEKIKEYAGMFGLDFDKLNHKSTNEVHLDVRPGKIVEILRSKSPEKHNPIFRPPNGPQASSPIRRMAPLPNNPHIQNQHGQQNLPRKLPTALRTGMHQDQIHFKQVGIKSPAGRPIHQGGGDDDSEGSEDSFTFQLQGYEPEHNQERRKSKQTPRVETETDDADVDDLVTDPVAAQKMIKEWMAMVGKDNNNEPKRPRLMDSAGYQSQTKHECTVCNATFNKETAWRWHEERHVGLGLFKCSRCDQLLKTARAVWLHEQNTHAFVGIAHVDLEEPRSIPPNFQIIEGRKVPVPVKVLARNSQPLQKLNQQVTGPANRNIAAIRMAQLKRMKASKMAATLKKIPESRQGKPFPQTNHAIGIGHSAGTEHLDSKKVKQLHWLYVCGKCDNCSDSSIKALNHYKKCYPDQEAPFESTVTKYRQGFYGKSKCPLCPRRYAANGGFMIHCGHMHQEYRSLFSHTGAAEDKLKCVSCQRKFALPDEFHEHLENGQECTANPINEESMPLLMSSSRGSSSSGTPIERTKRRPIANSRYAVEEEVTPVSAPAAPPPRSARLAKRQSLAAQALAEGAAAAQETKEKQAVNRRVSGIDYPPADCPICGASEVANISQHLTSDHQELNVTVNRISPDLLRCRKCLITFAICDLLGHTTTCNGLSDYSQTQDKEVQETPTAKTKPATEVKLKKEIPVVPSKEDLPPGVGCSPIDRIEIVDLHSKEALQKAMVCSVCGKVGVKLGDVAICLRAHGVHRCALCFNSYTNKPDYAEHLKTCHGAPDTTNSKTKVLRLKCPLCNKNFINAGQVASHMYSSHWQSLLTEMRQARLNGGSFINSSAETTKSDRDEHTETEEDDEQMDIDEEDSTLPEEEIVDSEDVEKEEKLSEKGDDSEQENKGSSSPVDQNIAKGKVMASENQQETK